MSVVRAVFAGVVGLGLGLALGLVFGGGTGAPPAPDGGDDPVEAAPRGEPGPRGEAPESRDGAPRVRKPRERAGPSGEVASLLERAAAEIPPPEIPEGDGRIEGTVKARTGEPLEGVEVKVVMRPNQTPGATPWRDLPVAEKFEHLVQGERLREATTRTTVTGPDGRFVLAGLPPVPHTVTGQSDHHRVSQANRHGMGVTPDAVVDLVGDPVVKVPLDIRFEDGTEPDQVMVSFASGGSRIATSWTPSNREAAVNPGTYKVSVAAGEHNELTAEVPNLTLVHGEPVEPIELVLASRPGIAGRLVLPEGAPFLWAAIGAELIGPDTTPESVAAGQQKTNANQHEGYRYAITGLTPGRYLLVAWNFHQGSEILASREVTVGDEMALVDLEVAGPEREDYLEIVATGPNGERLPVLQVGLRFKSERRNSSTGTNLVARPNGVVWAKHMSPSRTGGESGRYYAMVTHASYGRREVEYTPGPAARVEVTFEEPAFVDVTVVGAPADLLSAGLQINAGENNRGGMHGSGNTDAEGRARVGPMQPGATQLTAVARANRRTLILATQDINVRSGDNEAPFALPSLHTVRVECADPTAFAGQNVSLRKRDGDSRSRWSVHQTLPESGKALFRFVPAGKYQIRMGRERREITLPGNDLVRF